MPVFPVFLALSMNNSVWGTGGRRLSTTLNHLNTYQSDNSVSFWAFNTLVLVHIALWYIMLLMAVNRYLVRISFKGSVQCRVWVKARSTNQALINALNEYKHRLAHITSCCIIGEPIPVCKRRRKQQQSETLPDRADRYKAKERPKPPSVFDI